MYNNKELTAVVILAKKLTEQHNVEATDALMQGLGRFGQRLCTFYCRPDDKVYFERSSTKKRVKGVLVELVKTLDV